MTHRCAHSSTASAARMAQRSTNARMSRYAISGASLGSSLARFAGFSRPGSADPGSGRIDYWCKYLGFSPTKTSAYQKYTDLMARRRKDWNIFADAK